MATVLDRFRQRLRTALSGLSDDLDGHGFWRHQREAVAALVKHLSDPTKDPRASVVIPTAGGKTAIFGALVNAVAARIGETEPSARIVMLVPNLPLIAQVMMDFRTRHPEVDIGCLASRPIVDKSGHVYPLGRRPTTVMTYSRFMRLVASGELAPEDVDLVVMDEAHRGLSDMRREVFGDLFPDTVVVAFSATPEFDELRSLNGLMDERNLVYTADPQTLRDEGIIAPVANYVLAVRIEGDMPEEFDRRQVVRRKAHVDETLSFLDSLVDTETGMRPLDKVTLFYGSDRAHATMFAQEYNARFGSLGKRMLVLTGDDGPERLREAVAAIERGEVTGIANAQLLSEGFDLAKVGLVVNAPTGSIVKVIQQAGRAQRIDRALPIDDVGQTAFVIDTYMEIDGAIEGHPRWFFEALNEVAKAYSVIGPATRVEDIDVTGYEATATGDAPPETGAPAADVTARVATIDTLRPPTGPAPGAPAGKVAKTREYVTSKAVTAIRYLLRRRALGRLAEDKTEEWLSRSEFLNASARSQTAPFFESLEREFLLRRQNLDDRPIQRSYVFGERSSAPVRIRMAIMRSGAKPTICYHATCVPDLVRLSGAPMGGRTGGSEWITRRDMIDAVGAAWVEANELMTRTYGAFLQEERIDPEAAGIDLDGDFLRMRRIDGAPTWVAYHRDDVAVVRAILGVDHAGKAEGEFPRSEIAERLGIPETDKTLRAALETLRAQAKAGEPTAFAGVDIPAALRYSNGRLMVHVMGDTGIAALSRAIDAPSLPRRNDRWALTADLPNRTPEWLSRIDVYRILRTTYQEDAPLGILWDKLVEAPEQDGQRIVDDVPFRFRLMRALNRAVVCLHADDLERFRAQAGDPASPVPVDQMNMVEKEDGWYTLNKAGPVIGITATTPTLVNAWRDLAERLRDHGEVVVDGTRIDMRLMRVGGTVRPCLNDEGLDWLARRLGRPREGLARRREGELGRADVAKALSMKLAGQVFARAWLQLERDLQAGVDLGDIGARLTYPQRAMVIEEAGMAAFTARYGLDPAPEGFIDPMDALGRLRVDLGSMAEDRFRGYWNKIEAEQDGPSPSYAMTRFRQGRRSGWALAEADYPRLLASLRPPERQPIPAEPEPQPDEDWSEDWATVDEVLEATAARRQDDPARDLIRAIVERQAELGTVRPAQLTGISWNGVRVPLRGIQTRAAVRFALARLAIPALAPFLAGPAKADANWRRIGLFLGTLHPDHAGPLLEGIRQEIEESPAPASNIHVERLPRLLACDDASEAGLIEPVPVRLRVGLRASGNSMKVYVHRDSWDDLSRLTGQNLPTQDRHPDFVSREDAFAQIGITYNHRVDDVFRRAATAHAAILRLTGEHRPVNLEGRTLHPRRVASGKASATHFHREDVDAVAEIAGYPPKKQEGWLDRAEAAALFRVNGQLNPDFRAFWDSITARTEAGEPVVLEGSTLRTRLYRAGSRRPASLHEGDAQFVIDALGFVTVPKTVDWVDKLDAAGRLRTSMSNPRFAEAWESLVALAEGRRRTVLDGQDVRFRKVINGSRTPFCVHQDDLPALGRAIGATRVPMPTKTQDWVSEREFCEMHRTALQNQPVVNVLWDSFHEAASKGQSFPLATGTPRLAIVRHGAHDVACFHAGDLPLLRRHLGISPPATADEISADWRPRGVVSDLIPDELSGWFKDTWDDLSMTVVADPWVAPPDVRLRVDINGAGVIMRVHRDDVGAMADWALREAPAQGPVAKLA